MKSKKELIIAIAVIAVAIGSILFRLIGAKQSEKIKISASMQGFKGAFVQYIVAGMKDYLNKNNLEDKYELIVVDAEDRVDKQLSQIESFIGDKVDAIILNPVDGVGSSPAVSAAVKARIPIVTVNTTTVNQDETSGYIGSDDIEAGKIQMQFIADKLNGKGNVVALQGSMGHSAQVGRWTGYNMIADKYPNLTIVAEKTADWQTDKAQNIIENWIQAGIKFNAVATHADVMSMGALNALEAANITNVIIIGIDAIPDVMKNIKEGKITATVWQDGIAQGAKSIEKAISLINGGVKGDIIVPYELITIENIAHYENKASVRDSLNAKYISIINKDL